MQKVTAILQADYSGCRLIDTYGGSAPALELVIGTAAEITLVNFGFKVQKSSYRCPWHNWRFEDEQLKKLEHFYVS